MILKEGLLVFKFFICLLSWVLYTLVGIPFSLGALLLGEHLRACLISPYVSLSLRDVLSSLFMCGRSFRASFIIAVLWFAVSFVWVTSSSLFVLTFCSSLVLQFMSFLIVEFILPTFIFSRWFAIALVFSMNVFRVFCG